MFREPPATCAGCIEGGVGLCANLAREQVAQIASLARQTSFKKSQKISGRTSAPATALIVRSGTVKLCHTLPDGRHQIIDFLQSGDFAIRRAIRPHLPESLEALTDVTLCEIDLAELESLCQRSSELSELLFGAALTQIERKNNHILLLGRKRAGERVASFLLDMSDRATRRGEAQAEISLPMSRVEISDYLGLTPETVSRAFTIFRERRIVKLPQATAIIILDRMRLCDIADGADTLVVR